MVKNDVGSSRTRTDSRGSRRLRKLLTGGDRRSIAGANEALALVHANAELVSELATLVEDNDWLVSERALDVLEKLAHERPDWVAPFKNVFIGEVADSDKWEIRLQVVRALPLFGWSTAARRRAVAILCRDVGHSQTFVKAWALDSLARFAEQQRDLIPVVRHWLVRFENSESKALIARARHIRARLSI
jgi:hypothetical protein